MSSNLVNALNKATNVAKTENGAISNKTTNSSVLDLFSQISAYRTGGVSHKRIPAFRKAYGENPLLTLKCLFYARDIRGGQGERETFRIFLKELASMNLDAVLKNLHFIPEYGRWDDLFALVQIESKLDNAIVELIKNQLSKDSQSDRPSLMAKWLPSVNTSSAKTRKLAKWLYTKLSLTERQYRKTLALLRDKIRVLEAVISRNKWESVVYENVPSCANLKYRKAFKKHDSERYKEYINSVSKGEKKINASALYPYDIVRKCILSSDDRKTLDALWQSLPNFYGDKTENALVVVDVSGSMMGSYGKDAVMPITVAISLGIYMAERNKSVWHNKFITFSDNPKLQTIAGFDIFDKVRNLQNAEWGMSTNVEAVFKLVLKTALENDLTQDDMPNRIYIISDMEFNSATNSNRQTSLFRAIKENFTKSGYQLPELVFWNVAARNEQFPMSMDDRGFLNVSGCSPSILKNLLNSKNADAYSLMLETLNAPRYDNISL